MHRRYARRLSRKKSNVLSGQQATIISIFVASNHVVDKQNQKLPFIRAFAGGRKPPVRPSGLPPLRKGGSGVSFCRHQLAESNISCQPKSTTYSTLLNKQFLHQVGATFPKERRQKTSPFVKGRLRGIFIPLDVTGKSPFCPPLTKGGEPAHYLSRVLMLRFDGGLWSSSTLVYRIKSAIIPTNKWAASRGLRCSDSPVYLTKRATQPRSQGVLLELLKYRRRIPSWIYQMFLYPWKEKWQL
ncbi:MAG: hypothetical protein HW384_1746 [Dehalococcoidia bacterium]|nr:hypothetical protein [Dehalococcoidia bacterium]